MHGRQQLSLFNAHYDTRCFPPIHVYHVESGKPVAVLLRPGKTPSGAEVRTLLKHLVRRIRRHWPRTRIVFRGDSHYGRTEAMAWCEANGVDYIFGLAGNPVLHALTYDVAVDLKMRRAEAGAEKMRTFAAFAYAARSWILDETLFEAAQRVSRDNSRWNPRRAEPGHWLLRGLVKCGHCGVGVSCHKMRGRNGTFHRYYYCHNHDPLRAGGEHRRCPERNIRADELDTFVFEQVRETLLRPEVLLAGEHALSARREPVADELLQAQLAKLQRKSDAANAEKRRLVDLYQAALIDRDELLRRSKEVQDRKQNVEQQRDALIAQRKELAQQNALRERIIGFSVTVGASIDHVDFDQRQKLLRLVVEQLLVQGWRVEIKLRIPLDEAPTPPDPTPSSKDRLRSVGRDERRELSPTHRARQTKEGAWAARQDRHREEHHRGLTHTWASTRQRPRSLPAARRHPSRRAALCSTPPGRNPPQRYRTDRSCGRSATICVCRAATINETKALAIPYRARNHAAAAGARNLILIDARLSSRSTRYSLRRAPVPHGHWKTTTFVGACRLNGTTAPMVLDGAMHGAAFLAYVDKVLVPTLW